MGVGYYATQSELGEFVDRIGDDEARQLARSLSREYTASQGWETADRPLSEAGYVYDGVSGQERHKEGEEESPGTLPQGPGVVVIADADGRVVRDNTSRLQLGPTPPNWTGAGRRSST